MLKILNCVFSDIITDLRTQNFTDLFYVLQSNIREFMLAKCFTNNSEVEDQSCPRHVVFY